MKLLCSIVTIFLFCYSIHSQDTNNSDYYKAFDAIVGIENTNLINGVQFIDNYRYTQKHHRFFNSHEFLNGSIVYDSQLYNNLKIKYDLYENQVILELPTEIDFFQLIVNTNKITEFTIENHRFINFNSNKAFQALEINSFLEPIYSNKLQLYLRHSKSRIVQLKNNIVESKFKLNSQYVYFYNEKFYLFKSKNKLKKVFPKQANSINQFYKDNTILLKKNPTNFMIKLFALIDNQNQ